MGDGVGAVNKVVGSHGPFVGAGLCVLKLISVGRSGKRPRHGDRAVRLGSGGEVLRLDKLGDYKAVANADLDHDVVTLEIYPVRINRICVIGANSDKVPVSLCKFAE